MMQPAQRTARGGFSLVEMVAALTIFTTTVVALLGAVGLCVRSTAASDHHARACLLAQAVAEETLAESTLMPGQTEGDGGDAFPQATWTCEITETDTTSMYEAVVTVTWPERGRAKRFQLFTLAAER